MSTKIFHLPGVPYLDYPPGNVTVIDLVLIVKLHYKVQLTLRNGDGLGICDLSHKHFKLGSYS